MDMLGPAGYARGPQLGVPQLGGPSVHSGPLGRDRKAAGRVRKAPVRVHKAPGRVHKAPERVHEVTERVDGAPGECP